MFNHIARHLSIVKSSQNLKIRAFIKSTDSNKDKAELSNLIMNNNIQFIDDPEKTNVHILLSKTMNNVMT